MSHHNVGTFSVSSQVPSLSEYVSLWVELAENNLQSRVHEDVILMWRFLAQNITSGNMNIDDLKSAVKDMKNRFVKMVKSYQ